MRIGSGQVVYLPPALSLFTPRLRANDEHEWTNYVFDFLPPLSRN